MYLPLVPFGLTPLRFYLDCYEHRGRPVILDDAEHIMEDKVGAKLVSALGDTKPVKQLFYGTGPGLPGDVPASYCTTSPLCVIANKPTRHEDVRSRALTLFFDPTNLEIHRAVARWYWDQEIHDWFGRHLHRLPPLDARWYLTAHNDKRCRRDWRRIMLTTLVQDPASAVVQDLEEDSACPTREDKAARFKETMGASRATYFRVLQRLTEEGRLVPDVVPPIHLSRTRPPGQLTPVELDSMAASPPTQPEPEPRPLDVPSREEFSQPITGHVQAAAPARVILDDLLPWETTAGDEEGDE